MENQVLKLRTTMDKYIRALRNQLQNGKFERRVSWPCLMNKLGIMNVVCVLKAVVTSTFSNTAR